MTAAAPVLQDTAFAFGPPPGTGLIRVRPEDFRVEELPLVTPSGIGSHLWLEVEKTGANTNWVAGQLAAAAGVRSRDVGFAGMKDRHGITRQWFSVPLQEASSDDWRNWSIEDVTLRAGAHHERKLRRGVLAGNRFRLTVRSVEGDRADIESRLAQVAALGVPNYFGPQRFGHAGQNVAQARLWLEGGGRIPRKRRSIILSAARSHLFNRVLSERVTRGNWNRLLDGDIAMLDGRRSMFECTLPDPELERRCAAFDIHPTGPLPGRGGMSASGEAMAIEAAGLESERALADGLAGAGVDAGRRSLRLRVADLDWHWRDDSLELAFGLPPGGYATSMLREVVRVADAASRSGRMQGRDPME